MPRAGNTSHKKPRMTVTPTKVGKAGKVGTKTSTKVGKEGKKTSKPKIEDIEDNREDLLEEVEEGKKTSKPKIEDIEDNREDLLEEEEVKSDEEKEVKSDEEKVEVKSEEKEVKSEEKKKRGDDKIYRQAAQKLFDDILVSLIKELKITPNQSLWKKKVEDAKKKFAEEIKIPRTKKGQVRTPKGKGTRSGYIIFSGAGIREELKAKYPEAKPKEMLKLIAEEWKKDEKRKEKYNEMARIEKEKRGIVSVKRGDGKPKKPLSDNAQKYLDFRKKTSEALKKKGMKDASEIREKISEMWKAVKPPPVPKGKGKGKGATSLSPLGGSRGKGKSKKVEDAEVMEKEEDEDDESTEPIEKDEDEESTEPIEKDEDEESDEDISPFTQPLQLIETQDEEIVEVVTETDVTPPSNEGNEDEEGNEEDSDEVAIKINTLKTILLYHKHPDIKVFTNQLKLWENNYEKGTMTDKAILGVLNNRIEELSEVKGSHTKKVAK